MHIMKLDNTRGEKTVEVRVMSDERCGFFGCGNEWIWIIIIIIIIFCFCGGIGGFGYGCDNKC